MYDKFRSRVLFPIRDQNGHAVGLGGRLLEGDGPKYLNSPATPLFDKSRTLYLIDKAKGPIRKTGQAVIVEGYTDALMAHQAGFDNVVASLGTALTPGQVALLTRYASRIALAYDVDAAGEKAGTLGVTALAGLIGQLQADTSGVKLEDVRVARLPDGKDPDEVVRESPAAWEAAVAKAKPLVEYLIDHHAGRYDLKTSSGRIGFVESVMPALRDIDDPLRRDEALGEVHRVSGVEDRVAAPDPGSPGPEPDRPGPAVGAGERTGGQGDRGSRPTPCSRHPTRCASRTSCGRSRRSRRSSCACCCSSPRQQLRVVDELGPDQLPSTVARELFRAIVLQRAPNDAGHPPAVRLGGAAARRSTTKRPRSRGRSSRSPAPTRADWPARQLDYEVARLLIEIEDDQLRERSDYNEAAQGEAERAADREAIERLMLERRQINEMRLSLDRRRDQTRLLASHRR